MNQPTDSIPTDQPPTCRPPDPAPHPARFKPPLLACDCHAHIIGAASEYPMTAARSYTPPPASLASYRRMLDTLGVRRAVIVQPSFYGPDNRCTRDALLASEGLFRGIAVIDPDIPAQQLARMHEEGFRGARLNLLFRGGVSLDTMEALAALISRFGWHLQILMDISSLTQIESRVSSLPCPVVFDHLGHFDPAHRDAASGFSALERLLDNGRTWVKLSGGYRLSKSPAPYAELRSFAQRLTARRPDRLVWGSDWPHTAFEGEMPNDGALLDTLADWVPDQVLRDRILADNPAVLYGF